MRQRGWFGIFALMVPAAPAFAQSAMPTQGASVADRPRPEYAPIGGRIGSFFVYPEFGLGAEATDNVLATAENRRSDLDALLTTKASLQSGFTRHALDLSAHYDRSFHARQTSENVSRYGARLEGRYDIATDSWIAASGTADREVEPRSSFNSPTGASEPSRFSREGGTLKAQRTLGRLTLGAGGSITALRFSSVAYAGGQSLSQRYRDNNAYAADLLIGYEFRPGIRAIVRAAVDHIDYTLPADDPRQPSHLNRDSRGLRIEAGLRFELTSLLTGEARVGYLRRNYSAGQLRDTAGPSFGADLLWNVTGLTSLRFSADKRIDEAASATIAGNRVTEFGLAADHEYRRNLILSASARHVTIAPLGPAPSSHEIRASAGARLLLNRRLSVSLGYRFADRTSASVDHTYRENRVTIATLVTF
ncbi:outer membrane beta-barrel protein [Novosphingobium sp. BL-8H]|uniref:outer membrane beta-barrel protein n=1 Tax=Novosphingobium sp. BL-8H TaxID=3127640 RepID=UPI0037574343